MTWPLTRWETSWAVATLLLSVVFLGRAWLEGQRTNVEAVLQVGLPTPGTPLSLRDLSPDRRQLVRADVRSIRASSFQAPEPFHAPHLLEVLIPISRAACHSLEKRWDEACGSGHEAAVSTLAVEWEEPRTAKVRLLDASSLTATSVAGSLGRSRFPTWTLDPVAETVQVEFTCLESRRFHLVLPSEPLSEDCSSGGRLMRLKVPYREDEAVSLFLDGSAAMGLNATAARLAAKADSGSVFAGDAVHEVRHPREPVVMQTGSGALTIEMDAFASGIGQLHATGADVSDVRVNGVEQIPSSFEKVRDDWGTVMGTCLGIWLSTLGMMLLSWIGKLDD